MTEKKSSVDDALGAIQKSYLGNLLFGEFSFKFFKLLFLGSFIFYFISILIVFIHQELQIVLMFMFFVGVLFISVASFFSEKVKSRILVSDYDFQKAKLGLGLLIYSSGLAVAGLTLRWIF
ncbi:hypothetical protein [Pleionea litopenaei]|uniref:Uncharacterized protein n=1 Tax=Pleionea litopenaei TaxID=3070815 RepID=A0AA51X7Z4_9GAMM|nr:hypothetical protein [Pleionea sp. HL-JVS1]WMS87610.1 hypothetical protein Q9312_01485 [Pleionea sp. HL-JVS1]